jgi:hypothetical protein
MKTVLIQDDELRYRVVDSKGKVLREGVARKIAERFVEGLDEDLQSEVSIVPVTASGDQVLFG